MPGQRAEKPPTHVAHIYTCPSVVNISIPFKMLCRTTYSICKITILKINSSYSNTLSSDVHMYIQINRLIQTLLEL